MREIEVDGLGAAADPAFEIGAIVAGQRRRHVRRGGRIVAQVEDLLAERGVGDTQPARRVAADRLGGPGEAMVRAVAVERREPGDRKSTRLNSSHQCAYRMPSSD